MDFNVVAWLGENLLKLAPFRIIYSYERGVRWTLGQNPKALKSGFQWCWWIWHRVESFSVVEQVINLPVQSVMTADIPPIPVCFSVNVGFEIDNPVWHFCAVQNFDQSVKDLAMSHLSERVRGRTLAQLTAEGGLKELEISLKGTLTTRLTKWGTIVTHVGFTDFVTVQHQVRMFQDKPGALL